MARLIHSPTGSGPVNAFEALVVNTFLNSLPAGYLIVPNFSVKEPRGDTFEYDVVVLTPTRSTSWKPRSVRPHLRRRQRVDVESNAAEVPPMAGRPQVQSAQVEAWSGRKPGVSPVFVCPDQTQLFLRGNWADQAAILKRSVRRTPKQSPA